MNQLYMIYVLFAQYLQSAFGLRSMSDVIDAILLPRMRKNAEEIHR